MLIRYPCVRFLGLSHPYLVTIVKIPPLSRPSLRPVLSDPSHLLQSTHNGAELQYIWDS
jgi:hypothetical protein